jgi:hypothetical protein
VQVDLQANVCAITPTPDRMLDLAGVRAAVEQTAYEPGRMWLEARGAVSRGTNVAWFTIAATTVALQIDGEVPDGDMIGGELVIGNPLLIRPGAVPR